MKNILPMIMLAALFVAGCAPDEMRTLIPPASTSGTRTLNVFAAASLADAFTEIGENFEAVHPGVNVVFNFAGSQALRTQIEEGAPADIFASANQTEMEALITGGQVGQAASQIFLNNKLVVILPADNPAALVSLEDLGKAGIKLVLAAEEVPAGKYARQVLDHLDVRFGNEYKAKVLANIVSNEDNVRQVVAKVQLGEADAGIVYSSDAVAASDLRTIEIPPDSNVIAGYPIAAVSRSANTRLANAFIGFVLSAEGQAVLKKWGFAPPE